MDGCCRILVDEIHRFEGSVGEFRGDGVMALFRTPMIEVGLLSTGRRKEALEHLKKAEADFEETGRGYWLGKSREMLARIRPGSDYRKRVTPFFC